MTSRYQLHVQNWENCKRCELHENRHKTVLLSGKIPCENLFIGEAPGTTEDAAGEPFVGPAGNLLHRIISDAIGDEYRNAFTNLVACIPLDEEGDKTAEPPAKAITRCTPRLKQLLEIAKPDRVICVGALSWKHVIKWLPGELPCTKITHPAAILRSPSGHQSIAIQETTAIIRSFVLGLEV